MRAFVHKRDERSAQLEQQGVEIAVGDLLDFTTVRPALEDVWGTYFVYPIAPGLIEATASFAQAAKEARVPAIVKLQWLNVSSNQLHSFLLESGEYGPLPSLQALNL